MTTSSSFSKENSNISNENSERNSEEENEEEEEFDYQLSIFTLTSIQSKADPWEYISEKSIDDAYETTLYHIRLNKPNTIRIFRIHKEIIMSVVSPMFNDIHSVFIEETVKENSPPSDDLIRMWQACYSDVYIRTPNKKALSLFYDVIPYFYSYAVSSIYFKLPTPLGICPPKRFKIARRILYIFSSITYLNSAIKSIMNELFEPEVKLKPIIKKEEKSVLLPVEDITGLVDLERRPKNRSRRFDLTSISPISTKIHRTPLHTCKFYYPKNGDKTFKKELKPFTQKPKAPGDFTPDLDTKSLLMRARCRNVEYELQQVEMDAAVKRTKLMHFFQSDRETVETKRLAVVNATPEQKEIFIDQLRKNQERGAFVEDPKITLELLKNSSLVADVPPLSTGFHGKIEKIVDNVLSQCAVEQRRQEEVENHLTHEVRNMVIDVRRVFDPKPKKFS